MARRTREEAQAILLDAAEFAIERRGVLFTRPAHVAERAGYSPASVQAYFGTWNGLLEAVVDRACSRVLGDREDDRPMSAERLVLRCADMPRVVVATAALLIGGASTWAGTPNSRRLHAALRSSFVDEFGVSEEAADRAALRARDLVIGLGLSGSATSLSRRDAGRLVEWVVQTTAAAER